MKAKLSMQVLHEGDHASVKARVFLGVHHPSEGIVLENLREEGVLQAVRNPRDGESPFFWEGSLGKCRKCADIALGMKGMLDDVLFGLGTIVSSRLAQSFSQHHRVTELPSRMLDLEMAFSIAEVVPHEAGP